MQTTTAKLYSLEYNNARTYGFSALFIAGNILLPPIVPYDSSGWPHAIAHLLLHAYRGL